MPNDVTRGAGFLACLYGACLSAGCLMMTLAGVPTFPNEHAWVLYSIALGLGMLTQVALAVLLLSEVIMAGKHENKTTEG